MYSEAAGIQRMLPAVVAVPADADDVVAIVRWCADAGASITPRGSGSSMAGGALGPGVVVDLSRLSRIISIDVAARTAIVEPGVILASLNARAAEYGLRLPVDPSSAAFCSIGGMASTNAAGSRTLRYGQMNAWIRGVECVFADGTRAWIHRGQPLPTLPALHRFTAIAAELQASLRANPNRRSSLRKDSSGYALSTWAQTGSLVDLLIGSEGTLAVFTALEVQLAPVPAHAATLVGAFSSLEQATHAAAIAAELNASACELLDRTFLDIARKGGTLSVPDAEAVLIVEIEEAESARVAGMLTALSDAFRKAGATSVQTATDKEQSHKLWELRHAASPTLAAMSDTLKSMQVVEDGAVPPDRLAEYVTGLRVAFRKTDIPGVIFGHAGDGHVHANALVDVREPDWQKRLEKLFLYAAAAVVALGGTMSGEHGDGRLRAGALAQTWPPDAIDRFRAVKDAFDPHGILNPGVKFAAPDAPPLGADIKYDPSLAALPAAARRVLDRVQRDRAWNRSRLELLDEERAR